MRGLKYFQKRLLMWGDLDLKILKVFWRKNFWKNFWKNLFERITSTHLLKIEWFCKVKVWTQVDVVFFSLLAVFCINVLSCNLGIITWPIKLFFPIYFNVFKVKNICSRWGINIKDWMHKVLLKYPHLPPWDFCRNNNWYFMYLSLGMSCLFCLNA